MLFHHVETTRHNSRDGEERNDDYFVWTPNEIYYMATSNERFHVSDIYLVTNSFVNRVSSYQHGALVLTITLPSGDTWWGLQAAAVGVFAECIVFRPC